MNTERKDTVRELEKATIFTTDKMTQILNFIVNHIYWPTNALNCIKLNMLKST